MKKPDISIIIPCYNDGAHIEETIESVFSYTGKLQLEIIVVDDGSDYETKEVLKNLTIKYKEIILITQKNKGLSAARNTGIKKSTASYFTPLDSDDLIVPEFIDAAYAKIKESSDIGVVYGNVEYFEGKNELCERNFNPRTQFIFNSINAFALISKQTYDKTQGYDETMIYGYEDWEFWIQIMELNYKFCKLDMVSYKYRVKEQSMVTETIKKHQKILTYIRKKHINTLSDYYLDYIRENHDIKNNRRLLLKYLVRNLFGKANY